ncbi:MAG: universal stress protein [Planctomycetota bacterium]|nr:universal stress protein [Planctomycetota bacterium]
MFKSVLMAVDGSSRALNAVLQAWELGLFTNESAITLCSVIDEGYLADFPFWNPNEDQRLDFEARVLNTCLDPVRAKLEELGVTSIKTLTVHGDAAKGIVEAGASSELIVMGRRGLNAGKRLFLGSTARRVLALSKTPILIVPDATGKAPIANPRVVVTPIDLDSPWQSTLRMAKTIAEAWNGRIVLSQFIDLNEFISRESAGAFSSRGTKLFLDFKDHQEESFERLQGIVKKAKSEGHNVRGEQLHESIEAGISKHVKQAEASLIVAVCLAYEGAGAVWWRRSVSFRILNNCQIPVLFTKAQ